MTTPVPRILAPDSGEVTRTTLRILISATAVANDQFVPSERIDPMVGDGLQEADSGPIALLDRRGRHAGSFGEMAMVIALT